MTILSRLLPTFAAKERTKMEEKIETAKIMSHLIKMSAWATDRATEEAFDEALWTIIQTTKEK